MKFNFLNICFFLLCLHSCSDVKNEANSSGNCKFLLNVDSLCSINGYIAIDSKQNIIFSHDSTDWIQKVILIPCDDTLRDRTFRAYDVFLNLNTTRFGAIEFSATGVYVYKSEFGVPRDTFLFNSFSF